MLGQEATGVGADGDTNTERTGAGAIVGIVVGVLVVVGVVAIGVLCYLQSAKPALDIHEIQAASPNGKVSDLNADGMTVVVAGPGATGRLPPSSNVSRRQIAPSDSVTEPGLSRWPHSYECSSRAAQLRENSVLSIDTRIN